jgi:hypothetical protein
MLCDSQGATAKAVILDDTDPGRCQRLHHGALGSCPFGEPPAYGRRLNRLCAPSQRHLRKCEVRSYNFYQ